MSKSQLRMQVTVPSLYTYFGRYEGSRSAPAPRHAFLVGHERERTHLLDLLYMKSDLGSYLVTGPRGVGKTTLVRHCVDTYVRDVYERFSRSPVARSLADLLTLTAVACVALLALHALSRLSGFLLGTLELDRACLGRDAVRLLLASVCLGFCVVPGTLALRDQIPLNVEDINRELEEKRQRSDFWRFGARHLDRWSAYCYIASPVALLSHVFICPAAAPMVVSLVALTFVHRDLKDPTRPSSLQAIRVRVVEARRAVQFRQFALLTLSASALIPSGLGLLRSALKAGGLRLLLPPALNPSQALPADTWLAEVVQAALWTIAFTLLVLYERRAILQPCRRILYEPAFGGNDAGLEYARLQHWLCLTADRTIFNSLFSSWLPVVRVPINLGLDTLGHRHVVAAMLQGLRDAHRTTCMQIGSPLGLIGFGSRFLLTLLLTTAIHRAGVSVVSVLQSARERAQIVSHEEATHIEPVRDHADQRGPVATDPNRATPGATSAGAIWPLLSTARTQELLVERASIPLFPPESLRPDARFSMSEVFFPQTLGAPDVALALGIWLLLTWSRKRLTIFPHWRVDRRIGRILDDLLAQVALQQDGFGIAGEKVLKWSMSTPKRTVTTEPRDPRSLEQAFLSVLELLRKPTLTVLPGLRLSLPAVETIFIFDELDKVGTTTTLVGGDDSGAMLDAERERSKKLQVLLGDLKNLLCTAPARFIFVGGRNLHDEWLADEVNRSPLLTNIFDSEIYVRSLLTDHVLPNVSPPRITTSMAHYLSAQIRRAEVAWEQWQGSAGAGNRDRDLLVLSPFFAWPPAQSDHSEPILHFNRLLPHDSAQAGPSKELGKDGNRSLSLRFVEFLTFRSRGIPRRARLLLESFVRPYDCIVRRETDQRLAQHVLYFGDTDQHRVELISELFRATESAVLRALGRREDKVFMAVLQFADFLSRFHQSAFSLQSLERFEELMHVHRDPDTGTLAARLIEGWLGQLLEPTSAGIYAYRFGDHWSAEIAYLTRVSENESAAFNFTLDESQALKAQLDGLLARVKNGAGSYEVHVALGELNALDGDHIEARNRFRSAIEALDLRLTQEFGNGSDGRGHIQSIFRDDASESVRRQLDWGLTRIKVMLQIGVTYERTFDYQRAALEYANAHQVARRLFQAAPSSMSNGLAGAASMLFEPALALAWAAAKDPANLSRVSFASLESSVNEVLAGVCAGRFAQLSGPTDTNDLVAPAVCARLLANMGDLLFYSLPQHGKDRRPLIEATRAYNRALKIAAVAKDDALIARCHVSLAFCDIASHRYLGKASLSLHRLQRVSDHLITARKHASHAASGRGSHSDSMALHQLGVELAEELGWLLRYVGAHDSKGELADDGAHQVLVAFATRNEEIAENACRWLSDLRNLTIRHSERRAYAACRRDPRLGAGLDSGAGTEGDQLIAFPMRNRLLNMRVDILDSASTTQDDVACFLSLVEQFDQHDVLAPCRAALVARRLPWGPREGSDQHRAAVEQLERLWNMSVDVARGGKRYYAWLRDRFYLEDGYGPVLVRMNFAILVGLSDSYEEVRRLWRKGELQDRAMAPGIANIQSAFQTAMARSSHSTEDLDSAGVWA